MKLSAKTKRRLVRGAKIAGAVGATALGAKVGYRGYRKMTSASARLWRHDVIGAAGDRMGVLKGTKLRGTLRKGAAEGYLRDNPYVRAHRKVRRAVGQLTGPVRRRRRKRAGRWGR